MRYHQAVYECVRRYINIITQKRCYWEDPSELYPIFNFCLEVLENSYNTNYPVAKLNRHLGYIQGVLIEKGLTTVEAERNWTRPLFRPLDFPE